MNKQKVKTVFLKAPSVGKSAHSSKRYIINGDQFRRDSQAIIDEMEIDGYDLMLAQSVTSSEISVSYTEGSLLYFKLRETK